MVRRVCAGLALVVVAGCAGGMKQDVVFWNNYTPSPEAQEYGRRVTISRALDDMRDATSFDCRLFQDIWEKWFVRLVASPAHPHDTFVKVGCEAYGGSEEEAPLRQPDSLAPEEAYEIIDTAYPSSRYAKNCGGRRILLTVNDGPTRLYALELPQARSLHQVWIPANKPWVRVTLSCSRPVKEVE